MTKIFIDGKRIGNVKSFDIKQGFAVVYIPKDEVGFNWESMMQGTESPTRTLNGAVTTVCQDCKGVGGVNVAPLDCDECGAVGAVFQMNDGTLKCAECGHRHQNWHDCESCSD